MDFRLTDDDDPARLSPRRIRVVREGLQVGTQPAVLASVEPPLSARDTGQTCTVLLVSRVRGRVVDELLGAVRDQPAKVFVCRYVGDTARIPDRLERSELKIMFWGRIEPWGD